MLKLPSWWNCWKFHDHDGYIVLGWVCVQVWVHLPFTDWSLLTPPPTHPYNTHKTPLDWYLKSKVSRKCCWVIFGTIRRNTILLFPFFWLWGLFLFNVFLLFYIKMWCVLTQYQVWICFFVFVFGVKPIIMLYVSNCWPSTAHFLKPRCL